MVQTQVPNQGQLKVSLPPFATLLSPGSEKAHEVVLRTSMDWGEGRYAREAAPLRWRQVDAVPGR